MKALFSNKKYLIILLITITTSFSSLECVTRQIHPEPPLTIKGFLQQRPNNGNLYLSIGYLISTPYGRTFSSLQRLSCTHPLFDITQVLYRFGRINDTSKIEFSCPNNIDPNAIFDERFRYNTNEHILEAVKSEFYNQFLNQHRSFLIKKGFIAPQNCFFTLFRVCS